MFVGHYGVSFLVKKADPSLPLWLLFLAVQFLDVLWAPLILAGIEKTRIVPGFTASNPFDLYYMPYTHSLVAAILWAALAGLVYHRLRGPTRRAGLLVTLAVFSHWLLDLVVHRPDLAIYDDTLKVGFGLWDHRAAAFGLEATLLLVGIAAYFRLQPPRRALVALFGLVMLANQAYIFFGPPPVSPNALALTAIGLYAVFAILIWWLADRAPTPRVA